MDTETLRQHWPEVLEAVKRERRVAWILLNAASVDSLEGGVLTVAFNREGEAKGFATSGHDQVLTGVLATMLGLNVRVRAVVGTGVGPRGGRAAPAGPAAPGSRAGSHRGTGRAGHGRDDPPGGPGNPPSGPTSGWAAQGGHQTAKTEPGSTSQRGGSGRRDAPSAAQARPSGREKSLPDAQPPAPDYDEEWPDDAGPAGGGAQPTGMELIERQLGGKVIEEIEEP
jgi:DNA polymerase-3 subunit gamma/tau